MAKKKAAKKATRASRKKQSSIKAMDENEFWRLIEATRTPIPDLDLQRDIQINRLHDLLADFTAEQVAAFERRYHLLLHQAYCWKLWDAIYFLKGGAGDDGFEYFRRWLISQGKVAFYGAIANPDAFVAKRGRANQFMSFEAFTVPYELTESIGTNHLDDLFGEGLFGEGPSLEDYPEDADDANLPQRYPLIAKLLKERGEL